jgi:DNA repair exonuclease SbcCD nuclease subunit
MKNFIFTTDWHIRHNVPINRVDDVLEQQFRKIEEVLQIAKKYEATILHGGDLFNIYNPPYWLVSKVIDAIMGYEVDIYGPPGNHDLDGGSLQSLGNTAINMLYKSGVIKPLIGGHHRLDDIVVKSVLHRKHYQDADYIVDRQYDEDFKVIITHNLVTPNPVPFPHTLVSNIKTNAKLVLCGDFHGAFQAKHGDTWFVNPGCLLRQSIAEINHSPGVILFNKKSLERILLKSAPKGVDVFKDVDKKDKKKFQDFKDAIEDVKIEEGDILKSLEGMLGDSSKDTAEECRKRLRQAVEASSEY